jgi:hypothetical protein
MAASKVSGEGFRVVVNPHLLVLCPDSVAITSRIPRVGRFIKYGHGFGDQPIVDSAKGIARLRISRRQVARREGGGLQHRMGREPS